MPPNIKKTMTSTKSAKRTTNQQKTDKEQSGNSSISHTLKGSFDEATLKKLLMLKIPPTREHTRAQVILDYHFV